jgi:hypothetical protein
LLCGVDSTVDLLVVLMVGVALSDSRCFIDPLLGLLRVLLSVGLRLLLQVAELAQPSSCVSPGQAFRLAAFPACLPWRREPMRSASGEGSGCFHATLLC